MIKICRGNLLNANVEALVNTVNCIGIMGKGIALQFKQALPENFKAYQKDCRAGKVAVGQMFVYETGSLLNPKYIINFPTKRHWKGKSRIEDIEQGLKSLVGEVKRLGIKSVAVPPLGCGNGMLDWDDVRPRIEAAFSVLPEVDVFLYSPLGAPEPEKMPVRTKMPRMTRSKAVLIYLMDMYQVPSYRLSLLEVQKLAYFLQCTGEPLKLNFVKHQYGPYAENLNHVLINMEGHYTRGFGDRSTRAQINVLQDGKEKARDALSKHGEEVIQRLDDVRRLIEGFETPYGMELLSSVHWIATQDEVQAKTDPKKAIHAMHAWNERKRTIFRENHIHKAWKRLHNNRWFEKQITLED